jgi:hypothetical protein
MVPPSSVIMLGTIMYDDGRAAHFVFFFVEAINTQHSTPPSHPSSTEKHSLCITYRYTYTLLLSNNYSATTMRFGSALSVFLFLAGSNVDAFTVNKAHVSIRPTSSTCTCRPTALFAIDEGMLSRLDNIRRSYLALTERLGDPDVLADSKLLQKVMSDRAQSEEVVLVYEEYCGFQEELTGAIELFQDAGDDNELKEMARAEIKEIEPQMETLEEKMKILLLPQDPNDDRNIMLEIRAGTGGSEANIFAGTYVGRRLLEQDCSSLCIDFPFNLFVFISLSNLLF